MDDLTEEDFGTLADACYRKIIELVIKPLRQKHDKIKIQWPYGGVGIPGSSLDYSRCSIRTEKLKFKLFGEKDQLIVVMWDYNLANTEQTIYRGSGRPPISSDSDFLHKASFPLADPNVDEKILSYISKNIKNRGPKCDPSS